MVVPLTLRLPLGQVQVDPSGCGTESSQMPFSVAQRAPYSCWATSSPRALPPDAAALSTAPGDARARTARLASTLVRSAAGAASPRCGALAPAASAPGRFASSRATEAAWATEADTASAGTGPGTAVVTDAGGAATAGASDA